MLLQTTKVLNVSIPTEITASKTEATNWWLVRKNTFIIKPSLYRVLLWVVTIFFRVGTTRKRLRLQYINTCGVQKRKPQIDGFFLNELHIKGQEKVHLIENQITIVLLWEGTLYFRLVATSCCCLRLPCNLTTGGMPKTEAINWRLISKCSAHIRSGKSLYWKTR